MPAMEQLIIRCAWYYLHASHSHETSAVFLHYISVSILWLVGKDTLIRVFCNHDTYVHTTYTAPHTAYGSFDIYDFITFSYDTGHFCILMHRRFEVGHNIAQS